MSRERITRRQKNISRLLREKKQQQCDKARMFHNKRFVK